MINKQSIAYIISFMLIMIYSFGGIYQLGKLKAAQNQAFPFILLDVYLLVIAIVLYAIYTRVSNYKTYGNIICVIASVSCTLFWIHLMLNFAAEKNAILDLTPFLLLNIVTTAFTLKIQIQKKSIS
jgi:hypothetical protein